MRWSAGLPSIGILQPCRIIVIVERPDDVPATSCCRTTALERPERACEREKAAAKKVRQYTRSSRARGALGVGSGRTGGAERKADAPTTSVSAASDALIL